MAPITDADSQSASGMAQRRQDSPNQEQNLAKTMVIGKRQFSLLVYEILKECAPGCRVQRTAISALHEAAEIFIVAFFEEGSKRASADGRAEVMKKDIDSVREILRATSSERLRHLFTGLRLAD